MPKTATARSTMAAFALALAMSANAMADAPRAVDIPAGKLITALELLAKQSDVDFIYSSHELQGLRTKGVQGNLTTEKAVSKLLEGTKLKLTVHSSGAFVISDENAAADPRPSSRLEEIRGLEEIVVTGSRLAVVGDGAFELNVYTRAEIDRSGQATLNGFLSTLNEVSVTAPPGLGGQFGGQSVPQLRGLPVGTTLILINGRRVQTSGSSLDSSFFNLDVVPFAAIDRVEVLPVGSSAVYGGDALAGVINIVLKDSEDGFAVNGRHGIADGVHDSGASAYLGRDFDRGSFSLIGSYSDHSPLSTRDRAFFRDADYTRFGGRDARVRTCIPGTVNSTTSANLPGLDSSFAGIPTIASGGTPTLSDFVPMSGVSVLCSSHAQGAGFALVVGSEQTSVHGSGDFSIAESLNVFGEITYSETSANQIAIPPSLSNVLVPATNPFNPFGTAVRITTRLGTESGLSLGSKLDTEFSRFLVGLRGDIAGSWEFEASASQGRDESTLVAQSALVDTAARAAALASSDPNTALNPFTTGRAGSEALLRSIWSDRITSGAGTKDILSAFARGSVFSLPAGPWDAVVGVERGRDKWRFDAPLPNPSYDLSRDYNSAFLETRLPLLNRPGRPDTLDLAALTIAGRYDDYSDFGDATTYQLGLEVRPIDGLLFRYATATSFKPPTLLQLNPVPQLLDIELFGLVDPANGNAAIVDGIVDFGPNPGLQPEDGRARTIGVVWERASGEGPRLGLTHWRIEIDNNILIPNSPQLFLDNEALFPGFVVRGAPTGSGPGPVTNVFLTFVNFGEVDVSGIDFDAAYTLDSALGAWSVAASATRTEKYEISLTPNAPVVDRVDKLFTEAWAPQWKAHVSARLDRGAWSLGASGRYLGPYEDAGTSTRKLGDVWYVDVSASVDIGGLFQGLKWAEGITLAANAVNVTDELPRYSDGPFFFDTTQGNWIGRYVSLRLTYDRGRE